MPGTLTIRDADNASTGDQRPRSPQFHRNQPLLGQSHSIKVLEPGGLYRSSSGQFGMLGEIHRRAGNIGFDAEPHKQFRMPYKEGHVQFRFEAFNALNTRIGLGPPAHPVGSGATGVARHGRPSEFRSRFANLNGYAADWGSNPACSSRSDSRVAFTDWQRSRARLPSRTKSGSSAS